MTAERQLYKRQARDEYDMNLPEGKTCGDCVHFRRCNGIYGHIAGDEVCDWAPSRFTPRAALAAQVPQQGEA